MVLEYASSSWSSWISNSNSLQKVQNAALRSIANLYQSCLEDFLHLETGVRCRYQKNDDVTWDRYARLPQYVHRRVLQLKEAPTQLKTRIGCWNTTSERMNEIDIVRDTTTPHLPPWKRLENLTFDKVPLTKPKN